MRGARRGAWRYCVAVLAFMVLAPVILAGDHGSSTDDLSTTVPLPSEQIRFEWAELPPLLQARASPAIVVLADGSILAAGGSTASGPTASTEIYDARLGAWKPGPAMNSKRVGHTATLLRNGLVLIAGGNTETGATSSAELLDVSAGTALTIPSMTFARAGHAAVLLDSGKVLVTGGSDWVSAPRKECELYDPGALRWSPAGSMAHGRVFHSLQRLTNGSVLAIAGDSVGTSEIYDPASDAWSGLTMMASKRSDAATATLADGEVIAAGGLTEGTPLKSAELYDPTTNRWTRTGDMTMARASFSLSRLSSGLLLAAGSYSKLGTTTSCELFSPTNATWFPTQPMNHPRGAHGSAIGPNGAPFVIGGWSGTTPTSSVEAFTEVPIERPRYCMPIDIIPLVLEATELPGHSGNGLIAKLYAAQAHYDNMSYEKCLEVMNAFYNQLRAFARNGHMYHEHAAAIYDAYASVVECIGGTPQPPTEGMTF